MNRREELLAMISTKDAEAKAGQLIDEIVFIEEQMRSLKKLPFIRVNPNNPEQQKATPAARQYKELLQQYNSSLKLLLKISGDLGEAEETSPLRKWVESRRNKIE